MTRRVSFVLMLMLVPMLACGGRSRGRQPATTQPSSTRTAPPANPAPPPPSAPSGSNRGSGDDSLARLGPGEDILSKSLEELNAESPLEDIRYAYDSARLSAEARSRLDAHAQWLKRYPSVNILIEGHCDERGTVEYNLALGERRAMAAFNYLVSLGVPAGRMKTISYGKEFPLDPGHNEAAWARNRRAHFEITSK